jgi:hypothetical protein
MKWITVAVALITLFTQAAFAQPLPSAENTIYNSDTNHLWNRLNETLFERATQDGKKYGLDELDILYWFRTKNLLVEPSHQQALTILEEFINTHGEKLIRDPLKRALLQRDLWELFDWTTQYRWENLREREELQKRLAVVIRRIALTTNEIASLPDNYAQAEQNNLPDLPHGLFQTNGDWVTVGVNVIGDGRYGRHDQVAPQHLGSFGYRSEFFVLFHFPNGKPAAISYLNQLNSFEPAWIFPTNKNAHQSDGQLNPNLPQFPTNTEWTLVRRMCVIDSDGNIQQTPIIESIQARTYLNIPANRPENLVFSESLAKDQQFFEFEMSRRQNGALRAVAKDEKDFLPKLGRSMMEDAFESETNVTAKDLSNWQGLSLENCAACHIPGPGIYSVLTYNRQRFISADVSGKFPPALSEFRAEDFSVSRKYTRFEWGLLQGLWNQEN